MKSEPTIEFVLPSLEDDRLTVKVGDSVFTVEPCCSFTGAVFRNIDFSGLSLISCNFSSVTFENCIFAHTDFSHGRFDTAAFVDCDFWNASFSWAELKQVSFVKCELVDTEFAHSVLASGSFSQSKVQGRFLGTVLRSTRFADCALDGSGFVSAKLLQCSITDTSTTHDKVRFVNTFVKRTEISTCTLQEVMMSSCRFVETRFVLSSFLEGIMKSCTFIKTTFIHVGFDEVRLISSTFTESTIKACRFGSAIFDGAIFDGCHIQKNGFVLANLRGIVLYDSELDRNFYGNSFDYPPEY